MGAYYVSDIAFNAFYILTHLFLKTTLQVLLS